MKVKKIKPAFPKNAHKVVAAIYKMYDEMSIIAIDLGEKKDFFMRNPDTWMLSPDEIVQRGDYEMLYGEYLDTLSYYKEALRDQQSWHQKSPVKKASKAKKKTVAQLRKECKEKGLVYDAKTKKCRESKRKKKAKKSPAKAASKAKKKTVAQLKKECKEQGLVYDAKTKKCRESKRKKKAKKSPTKAKKSPAKAKKGRKGPTESATLFNVGTRKTGNDGNMWEVVTNKNGTKRWKKDTTKKAKSKRKVPGFFDAWDDVNPGYSKWDYGTGIEPEDEVITKYIKDTGKITGDILYVGSSYESRQEYGIVIVDLSRKRLFENTEDFYYLNPSLVGDDEIIKELTQHNSLLKNSKKAVKEYIAWYKDSMMF